MKIEISPATNKTVESLAELLGEYQEFYESKQNHTHNLKFLQNFLGGSEGVFFIARIGKNNIGYTSLYFSYSSVGAKRIAILNDLYVRDDFRGQGAGKALIDFAIDYSRSIGISHIRWCTRIKNDQAQKLYSKYDSAKTDWFHYDLVVDPAAVPTEIYPVDP